MQVYILNAHVCVKFRVTKVFARGACAETRANNYAVKSLGIVNEPGCFAIASNDSSTCTSVFSKGARYVPSTLRFRGRGSYITSTSGLVVVCMCAASVNGSSTSLLVPTCKAGAHF